MDVKTLRHLRPPVSTFHFSSLLGDHFTNFGYHTVAKSSTPFSEVWHKRSSYTYSYDSLPTRHFTFIDALALGLPIFLPFAASIKPSIPLFHLSANGPSNLVVFVFLFLISQISPQGREICETLPSLISRQVNSINLRSR